MRFMFFLRPSGSYNSHWVIFPWHEYAATTTITAVQQDVHSSIITYFSLTEWGKTCPLKPHFRRPVKNNSAVATGAAARMLALLKRPLHMSQQRTQPTCQSMKKLDLGMPKSLNKCNWDSWESVGGRKRLGRQWSEEEWGEAKGTEQQLGGRARPLLPSAVAASGQLPAGGGRLPSNVTVIYFTFPVNPLLSLLSLSLSYFLFILHHASFASRLHPFSAFTQNVVQSSWWDW